MADSSESPTRIPIRSTSPGETRNRSKRQSLLLQPGTLVAATQRQASENAALPRVKGPSAIKQRPVTMFNPNVPSLADLAAQFGTEDTQIGLQDDGPSDTATSGVRRTINTSGRPSTIGRGNKIPSATTTTTKTALIRSQSLRKPTSSATVVGETSARGVQTRSSHALNSSMHPRPLSTLAEHSSSTKFNLSRPTSSASSNDSHSTTTLMRNPNANASASQTSLRRTASTRANARTKSGLPAPLSQQGTGNVGGSGGGLARFDQGTNTTMSERPAFTTHQQYYSPLKRNGPKPLSSSLIHSTASLASSSYDSTSNLGFDSQVLQAQVLQLTLLHRDGERTMREWERSARERLRVKFDSVAKKAERVATLEREAVKARNIAALRAWGAPPPSSENEEAQGIEAGVFAELMQTLARVVQDVSLLVEEGGRVENVLREFRRWASHVEVIWGVRGLSEVGTARDEDVIEGLGETWRTEVANLTRRLGGLGRTLESLPQPDEGSAIEVVLKGFGELVRGLEKELKVVREVEQSVGERERKWVDEKLADMGPRIGIAVG